MGAIDPLPAQTVSTSHVGAFVIHGRVASGRAQPTSPSVMPGGALTGAVERWSALGWLRHVRWTGGGPVKERGEEAGEQGMGAVAVAEFVVAESEHLVAAELQVAASLAWWRRVGLSGSVPSLGV